MIIYTKQGQKRELPFLVAYEQGVFSFQFSGVTSYIDPFDSSVWNWEGVTNDVDEVLAVVQGDDQLIITLNLNDCIALDGSFYWDDAEGVLYVHYKESAGDWSIARDSVAFSSIVAGYASGYNKTTNNIFDGVFYDAIITSFSGLTKEVDPTKLGLIAFNEASVTYTDQTDQFKDVNPSDVVGEPYWVYAVEEGATELTDDDRVFTGFLNGLRHNRGSVVFTLTESRFFQNQPVCPNVLTTMQYPNAGKKAGKVIPTAWGDIRRGRMLLTNEASLTTAASGTAVFLVSDPSILDVRAITTVYDKDDISVAITASNLTNCTVEVTKPAGVSPTELDRWKWEGEGCNISGTYNNGLDILKAAFFYLTDIPFLNSTFDTTTWNAETAANPEDIGISLQSDRGFIEELVEPISTSLQGVVEILGDGRISWASRDTTASVSDTIDSYGQLDLPKINESPESIVSELVVNYSPDFVDDELGLVFTYSDQRTEVIQNYSIDRRDPLSPVETVLTNSSDANTIAQEIMETSADPERIISVTHVNFIDSRLFGIIAIDTGGFEDITLEYGELLNSQPDYINNTEKITIRVIPNYEP